MGLRLKPAALIGLLLVAALPLLVRLWLPASEKYYLHLLIQILLWSFIYTGWSLMGRFGLTSLGHGAFTGIGAYATVMLWNFAGITHWIGIPVGVAMATVVGVLEHRPTVVHGQHRATTNDHACPTHAASHLARCLRWASDDASSGRLRSRLSSWEGAVWPSWLP